MGQPTYGHPRLLHAQGLARQMSRQFLGTQIDAVYHTAIVFGGIEYYFGAGVQTTYPGATHHGRPMEIVKLGRTELPVEVILEYLESLKAVYTAEVRALEHGRNATWTDAFHSPMTSSYTTATISRMILPCFWLAKTYRSTLHLSLRPC